MNTEQALAVMGYIDLELIENFSCSRKRKPQVVRVILIAACLCAALAGTVLAAELLRGVFYGGRGTVETPAGAEEGIGLLIEGMEPIPKESMNEAFLELAAEHSALCQEKGIQQPLIYKSWSEAAGAMGLPLAESGSLTGKEADYTCRVYVYGGYGLSVWSRYRMEGEVISVWAWIKMESLEEEGWKRFVTGLGEDTEVLSVEDYPMPDGSRGLIVESQREGASRRYEGYFVKDGVLYMVDVRHVRETGKGREMLEKVLDGVK